MVSCSGFGLPMHAQLLRLFVTMQEALSRKTRLAKRSHDQRNQSGSNQNMLVTLGTFALAEQPSLIHTTLNITRSSRINLHDIHTNTTSYIKQVQVNTLQSLFQHFWPHSDNSDGTQCHAPEPKSNASADEQSQPQTTIYNSSRTRNISHTLQAAMVLAFLPSVLQPAFLSLDVIVHSHEGEL